MTLRALLSHRPILQMWTLRYRSGDTALAKILNCVLWEPRGATLDSVPVWWWGWGRGVLGVSSHTGAEQG